MSKKDYVMLASIVADCRAKLPEEAQITLDRDLVVPMSRALKRDNPRFDYSRFLHACGVAVSLA